MPVSWCAPGRVNLIGEHTDYNGGFALPFAIEQACTATVERLPEPVLEISSAQLGSIRIELAALRAGGQGWSAYAAGVGWALRERGYSVPGLRIELDSTVPTGGGLSSSAGLVCSVATAVDDLLELELGPVRLLELTRSVENDYVGAPTGGMDQLAALQCSAGNALFCDMLTLETEQVPLPLESDGLAMLVIDTKAEHRHADGEYRQRRAGCEEAAELLDVPLLRDIGVDQLDAALAELPTDELRRYTRHVVTEDDRVLRTVELLRAGRLREIGPLLTASHASMREDYRITIDELDVAVDALLAAGAFGARMTGGGFGGCVIALLASELVEPAAAAVRAAYTANGFRDPAAFQAQPCQGAHRVG
ncbi:MAG: galactokinase [Jatrophihabitantaceae bacterium]